MEKLKDKNWFRETIVPQLKGYEIEYRFYEEGDLGSLDQIIFNSEHKGGGIDFWGLGWLGIDVYDYKNEKEILNILLKPEQSAEKNQILEDLVSYLI